MRLETENVKVLGDGAKFADNTVASNQITLAESASRVIVGLPYRYTIKPMRFDMQIQGTTKGSVKRFAEIVLSLYRSMNVEYGVDVDNLFKVDFRTEEVFGTAPALFTGDKIVTHEGGFDPEDSIVVTGNGPFPCTLRSMVPRIGSIGR